MNMTVPLQVWEHVKEYLAKNLPQYQVQDVMRKSRHPDDHYLYIVIAKHKNYSDIKRQYGGGEWVVWTCWNESTRSLNHGHYDIKDYNCALGIAEQCFIR